MTLLDRFQIHRFINNSRVIGFNYSLKRLKPECPVDICPTNSSRLLLAWLLLIKVRALRPILLECSKINYARRVPYFRNWDCESRRKKNVFRLSTKNEPPSSSQRCTLKDIQILTCILTFSSQFSFYVIMLSILPFDSFHYTLSP